MIIVITSVCAVSVSLIDLATRRIIHDNTRVKLRVHDEYGVRNAQLCTPYNDSLYETRFLRLATRRKIHVRSILQAIKSLLEVSSVNDCINARSIPSARFHDTLIYLFSWGNDTENADECYFSKQTK